MLFCKHDSYICKSIYICFDITVTSMYIILFFFLHISDTHHPDSIILMGPQHLFTCSLAVCIFSSVKVSVPVLGCFLLSCS